MSSTDAEGPRQGPAGGGGTDRGTGPRPADAPPGIADLQASLHTAEQRLRELTDQCLGFLEELGEARRRERAFDELRQRIEGLQNQLADARRKLRDVSTATLRASNDATGGALDVVVWHDDGVPATADELAALVAALPGVPITFLASGGPPGADPPAELPDAVRWVRADAVRTPAQAWNTGLGLTDAAAVLFLRAGAIPRAGPWRSLPGLDPTVLVVQPATLRGADVHLGCQDGEALDVLAPQTVPESVRSQVQDRAAADRGAAAAESARDEPVADRGDPDTAPLGVVVPFADPDAFVVVRAAAARVGCFDEDLLGPVALAEFALRGRAAGLRVVGWPATVVDATSVPLRATTDAATDEVHDRDRMLVLARHRPGELGSAWAMSPFLWRIGSPARFAYFRSLLERIPGAEQWAQGPELLAAIADSVIGRTLCLDEVRRRMTPLLQQAAAELGELDGVGVDGSARAVLAGAGSADLFERVEVLCDVQQSVHELFASRIHELSMRLAAVTAERDAARAELAAANEARDAAQQQADQAAAAREHAERSIGQQAADAERRLGALQESLDSIAHAIDLIGQPHPGRVRERLLVMRDQASSLSELLVATGQPDVASLIQALHDQRQTLIDRERWVALLLEELRRRRFGLFRRRLLPHEIEFLERINGAQP